MSDAKAISAPQRRRSFTVIRRLPPTGQAGIEGAETFGQQAGIASGLPFIIDAAVSERYLEASRGQFALKRGLDVVLSATAMIIFLPLLVMIALAVKLTSSGPVLFVQERPGLNGKCFPMLKFRTMYLHLEDRTGVSQTVRGDPRVTRLGRLLRRTSIDEVPQLVNVLVGHMSLIGPRPHPFGILAGGRGYRSAVPYYELRSLVRPGLSGWAQVNGYRGPTDDIQPATERIRHDIAYIQNFTLALDLRIMAKTLWTELRGGTGL